jgi:hypothetical protein
MTIVRAILIAAAFATAAFAQTVLNPSAMCPALNAWGTNYFSNSQNLGSCELYWNAESAYCKCLNSSATNSTGPNASSCLNVGQLSNQSCGLVVYCINAFFTALEMIPSRSTSSNGCNAWSAYWSAGVLNGVLASPGNFSHSKFAMECGALVCQLTHLSANSFCWTNVGGGSYGAVCSSFSIFGTTTVAASNTSNTSNTTTSAAATTTTTTTAAASPNTTKAPSTTAAPKSGAVQASALMAVAATLMALAAL